VTVTPFSVAMRFVGLREISGDTDHPFIQWCFTLCGYGMDTPDEVPWCSAFMQHPFWQLNLARSKSARARSWLKVGIPVALHGARPGYDVVILKRGGDDRGPEVIAAPGHVGFFADLSGGDVSGTITVLGGNQADEVNYREFPASRLLGVRRVDA